MKVILLAFVLNVLLLYTGVSQQIYSLRIEGSGNVGDISFNKEIDDRAFCICNQNEVFQYHSLKRDGWEEIREEFKERTSKIQIPKGVTAYITVRFIINCHGNAGYFRVLIVDESLKPIMHQNKLGNLFLQIIQSKPRWLSLKFDNQPVDYYQIVTFKVVNGQVTDILP